MQYDKMKFSVGVFVLTLFIFIFTFLYFVLEEKGTFNKRYNYNFHTVSANSFSIGMPLKFSGFNIGTLDDIKLLNDGSVDMTFSVDEKNRRWIAIGSVLILKKPLIGSPHIEVYSNLDNVVLKEGSSLEILMSDDINDMIEKLEPIVAKATNIITNIDILTASFADKDSDFMKTLKNINTFTSNLADQKSLLTAITGDKASTQTIINSLNETIEIMKNIKKMSDEIAKITLSLNNKIINPTASSISEVEGIMKDIKAKLELLNGTVKSIGSYDKNLLQLKEQISVGLQKSNQIMDKVDSLMQNSENSEVILP